MNKPTYEELAAQVEVLRTQLDVALNCITCADETGYVQDVGFVDLEQVALDITETLKATPTACLAQVKADAGRAGYFRGHLDAGGSDSDWNKKHSEYHADQYAESIRQEVV